MFNELCPGKKRVQILRACHNREADMSEASSFATNVAGSQASNRSNAFATSAAAATAAANAAGLPDAAQQEKLDYMTADFLRKIDDRVNDGYDWSTGYYDDLQDALENCEKSFYYDLDQSILDGTVDDEQVLFNERKYRPKNAHPDEQQVIVYQHLFFHDRK